MVDRPDFHAGLAIIQKLLSWPERLHCRTNASSPVHGGYHSSVLVVLSAVPLPAAGERVLHVRSRYAALKPRKSLGRAESMGLGGGADHLYNAFLGSFHSELPFAASS